MNTKLTLTIDESLIIKAKQYARGKGRSLSDLIENYLMALTSESKNDNEVFTPIVKSMKGSFKAPENFDYKQEITKALKKKYDNK